MPNKSGQGVESEQEMNQTIYLPADREQSELERRAQAWLSRNPNIDAKTDDVRKSGQYQNLGTSEQVPTDRNAANPDHYAALDPQPWDVVNAWGLDYFEGSILKYLSRWRRKNGLQDLYKARQFLDKLIVLEEGG